MQVIQREDSLPINALRSFLGVVLITACLIRILTVSDGVIESLVLCALVQIAIVFAYYSISDNNETLRRRIRLHLSAVAAIGCAILQSHGGLRVRSLDLTNAMVFGVGYGVATHALGMLTAAISSICFRQVRRFPEENECRMCGYDLTGNESGICPECGERI